MKGGNGFTRSESSLLAERLQAESARCRRARAIRTQS